jgi:hypothetical protein
MKHYIFTILISLLFVQANAQTDEPRHCGSADHLHDMEINNPAFAKQRILIEQQTNAYVANPTKQLRAIKSIPVVVHVVYNLASQNITDAQIASQIAVLNADFKKLNADFANTPSVFQPMAANCEIEFCLASQDASGLPTNGITRTLTSTISFTNDNKVKSTLTGGKDAWPASKYLNIWVCKLSSSLLGYAQFPGGAAATDGVVIATKAFGTISGSGLSPVYNKGRTATHEVGHWLNLYHIWGDDGTACYGTDQVNDTPNQAGANTGCPTFPKVTSCSPNANGEMFMNFMDYTNDACMSMFTAGQKTRIDALFAVGGFRSSLLASKGCQAPSASAKTCGEINGQTTVDETNNSTVITWNDMQEATQYDVEFRAVTTNDNEPWVNVVSKTNRITIVNLLENQIYEYSIQALCSEGLSDFSQTQMFKTSNSSLLNPTNNNTRIELLTTSLYPQPAQNVLHAKVQTIATSMLSATFHNTIGQRMLHNAMPIEAGESEIDLDVSSLPNGMYVLEIKINETRTTQKILIQR